MAVIAANAASSAVGVVTVVKTVLSASDTLQFSAGQAQTLVLENDTGSPVNINIDGDKAVAFVPGGIGVPVDLSLGFTVIVPSGEARAVALKNIQRFLVGVVTVTGGAGAKAYVLT